MDTGNMTGSSVGVGSGVGGGSVGAGSSTSSMISSTISASFSSGSGAAPTLPGSRGTFSSISPLVCENVIDKVPRIDVFYQPRRFFGQFLIEIN
jgi:hypothetical protein